MKHKIFLIVIVCLFFAFLHAEDNMGWTDLFSENKESYSSIGRNTFFILEPGFQLILEGKEDDEKVKLIITVLFDTKTVNGVETRIVEEKEWKDEELIEISRNYFVISKRTDNVYYFGEDVDIYNKGKVVDHGGAWLSGDEAKYGLIMPGSILLGSRYYQEIAPNIAMDRAEIVSMTETIDTPAGTFKNCLKIQEGSALNPKEKGYKYYAPGIGLIKDGSVKLVKYGFLKK